MYPYIEQESAVTYYDIHGHLKTYFAKETKMLNRYHREGEGLHSHPEGNQFESRPEHRLS
jgi:hypothetical protein